MKSFDQWFKDEDPFLHKQLESERGRILASLGGMIPGAALGGLAGLPFGPGGSLLGASAGMFLAPKLLAMLLPQKGSLDGADFMKKKMKKRMKKK